MSQLLLSSLAVVCPNCDAYNAPASAVCATCATPLGAKPAAARPGPPRAASGPARPPSEGVPPGLKPAARPLVPPSGAPQAAQGAGLPTPTSGARPTGTGAGPVSQS